MCDCDRGFAGELCDICAPGHAGDDCNSCAPKFRESTEIEGLCEPDPCMGEDCSAHGTCYEDVTETGIVVARCACESAFQGDICELCKPGYEGDDCETCSEGYALYEGECVPDVCVGVACRHGACSDVDGDGTGECVCDDGWDGDACEECAAGHVLEDGECIPDVCAGVDCDHGTCRRARDGDYGICVCDDGWDGDACDECAPGYTMRTVGSVTSCVNELPVRDGRLGRVFDAAAPWTMVSDAMGRLAGWYDRYGSGGRYENPSDSQKPRQILLPPAVEFDGVNDDMWTHGAYSIRDVESYSVFLVVTWNPSGGPQTILDSIYPVVGSQPEAYALEVLDANTVRFRHHDLSSPSPDVVTSDDFDATEGRQLIVVERRPLLMGTALLVSNGTDTTVVEATNGPFEKAPLGVLGRCTVGGPIPDCHLDGNVHEYIIYDGLLTAEERDAVIEYLRVKWSL